MASKTSNVYIKHTSGSPFDMNTYPCAAATTAARGDLCDFASGGTAVTVYDAAADSDAFIGLSDAISRSTDSDPLPVLHRAIADVTTASATYRPGDGLIYTAGDNGTDWTFGADTNGTDIVAWSWEYGTTKTTLAVLFDSFMTSAGRLTGGTGLWEVAVT